MVLHKRMRRNIVCAASFLCLLSMLTYAFSAEPYDDSYSSAPSEPGVVSGEAEEREAPVSLHLPTYSVQDAFDRKTIERKVTAIRSAVANKATELKESPHVQAGVAYMQQLLKKVKHAAKIMWSRLRASTGNIGKSAARLFRRFLIHVFDAYVSAVDPNQKTLKHSFQQIAADHDTTSLSFQGLSKNIKSFSVGQHIDRQLVKYILDKAQNKPHLLVSIINELKLARTNNEAYIKELIWAVLSYRSLYSMELMWVLTPEMQLHHVFMLPKRTRTQFLFKDTVNEFDLKASVRSELTRLRLADCLSRKIDTRDQTRYIDPFSYAWFLTKYYDLSTLQGDSRKSFEIRASIIAARLNSDTVVQKAVAVHAYVDASIAVIVREKRDIDHIVLDTVQKEYRDRGVRFFEQMALLYRFVGKLYYSHRQSDAAYYDDLYTVSPLITICEVSSSEPYYNSFSYQQLKARFDTFVHANSFDQAYNQLKDIYPDLSSVLEMYYLGK